MTFTVRVLLLSLLFAASSLFGQSGHWEGTIQAPEKGVTIAFDLSKSAGTFTLPARNLKGLPLSNVVFNGTSVTFEIKGEGGGVFTGTVTADGQTMEGKFAMRGPQSMEMPFSLKRSGDARIEAAAKSAPIDRNLEGKWIGTIDVDGKQKQVGLTLANHPDASSGGSVTSEGMEIAIDSIVQNGRSVTLELKNVGGSYAGTLKDDGTINGTWTQPPFVGPLYFRREQSALDRWADAVGGREKIAAIRSIYREATIEIGGLTGSIKVWHTADGKYRKEEQVGTWSNIETFDGKIGTVQQGAAESRQMTDRELEIATSKAYANTNAILFAFAPEHHHGSVAVENDGTIVLRPQGGIEWRVALDPETSLPKTMTHVEGGRTVTVDFAAYDAIDGYKFEKEIHRSTGDPRFSAVIHFTKTVVNAPVEATLFAAAKN
jgi:hypothetical protein